MSQGIQHILYYGNNFYGNPLSVRLVVSTDCELKDRHCGFSILSQVHSQRRRAVSSVDE